MTLLQSGEPEHAMASQIAMDDNGEAKIRFWS
jgi:hypothetical protein